MLEVLVKSNGKVYRHGDWALRVAWSRMKENGLTDETGKH